MTYQIQTSVSGGNSWEDYESGLYPTREMAEAQMQAMKASNDGCKASGNQGVFYDFRVVESTKEIED